jgi:uncharacterized membrane protein
MITLRLVVPVVLVAAAVAGWFTYFVSPSPPVKGDQRSPLTAPDMAVPYTERPANLDQLPRTEEQAAAFQQAAEEILKRARNARASADEPPITGHIPLPRRRPIERP